VIAASISGLFCTALIAAEAVTTVLFRGISSHAFFALFTINSVDHLAFSIVQAGRVRAKKLTIEALACSL
jgi:hypothetical protein